MITESEKLYVREECRRRGWVPGMDCQFLDPLQDPQSRPTVLRKGYLYTVPGHGASRGPFLRVKVDDSYEIVMVSIDRIYIPTLELRTMRFTAVDDLEAWLDS